MPNAVKGGTKNDLTDDNSVLYILAWDRQALTNINRWLVKNVKYVKKKKMFSNEGLSN